MHSMPSEPSPKYHMPSWPMPIDWACSSEVRPYGNDVPLPSSFSRHGMSTLQSYSGAIAGIGPAWRGIEVKAMRGPRFARLPEPSALPTPADAASAEAAAVVEAAAVRAPRKPTAAVARPPTITVRRESRRDSTSSKLSWVEGLLGTWSTSMSLLRSGSGTSEP